MRNLIAIDPGLQGTGYAVWRDTQLDPEEVGVIHGPKSTDSTWIDRVDNISKNVLAIMRSYDVQELVCEMMEHYNTASSTMSWAKGDLQRTMFLIGTIHGMAYRSCHSTTLVTPREWKGQTPKSVTIKRVTRILTPKVCQRLNIRTHAWDAVGIGLYHRGVLK